jgi:sugar (pentulose or hexulose) kinase
MSIVAGVDFGTLSVRVTLVDSEKGPIGTASASYPLHRRRDDPNYATQSHVDQMTALAAATRDALKSTGVSGAAVTAIALDTTGSSVIPVGQRLEPLDEYYLWCDHRAFAANPLGRGVFDPKQAPFKYTLEKGQSATFRYRIVIYPNAETTDELNKAADAFATEAK